MSVNQAVEIYESVIFISFVLVKRNMFFLLKLSHLKMTPIFILMVKPYLPLISDVYLEKINKMAASCSGLQQHSSQVR